MRLIRIAAILFFVTTVSLVAQVGPAGPLITDSSTIKNDSANIRWGIKSPLLLTVSNIILPGSAQMMCGKPKRTAVFLAFDAILAAGAIATFSQSGDVLKNSRGYAVVHAGTHSTRSAGDSYWSDIGNYFQSSGSNGQSGYNSDMERMGMTGQEYLAAEDQWQWDGDQSRTEYLKMRASAQRLKVVGTFCIAGLAFNRIVALIDLRAIIKRGALAAGPTYDPVTGNTGIVVSGNF